MAVPNIFASATSAIPLSQLDQNFATAITLGNTAVYLGNTTTSLGNVTLTNVTISSGNVTLTGANVSGTANVSTLIVTGNQTSLGNVAITGNVSANIATFGAGSNTAPSITTTGDTNTGIFFPAADTIAFTEGGVESMRIYSSGNVGIGTSSPAVSGLEISRATGSATPTPVELRLSTTTSASDWSTTDSWGRLSFYSADASSGGAKIQGAISMVATGLSGGLSNMVFQMATSTPSLETRMEIDVYGGLYTYPIVGSVAAVFNEDGVDADFRVESDTNTHAFFVQGSDGNVGIGTSSPSKALDVAGEARVNFLAVDGASDRYIYITSSDGLGECELRLGDAADTDAGSIAYNNATNSMQFRANAAERMRIDSAGNVQVQTGAVMPYAPAPAAISAAATLTNANIQAQIISATGTTYTITMPLGTTLETLATWVTTGIAYDFYVINTASGTITMAVNTGVTSLGTLTIATGVSAQFRIRRTAANTFVLYRLG